MRRHLRKSLWTLTLGLLAWAADAPKQLTIQVRDYAAMPISGSVDGQGQNRGNLARVNFLREEPGQKRERFFVNDQNGVLYVFDKQTKRFTAYLDFNGRDGHKGLFHRFTSDMGLASGLICFQFDPDYARNGKFFTIHMEDPALQVTAAPDNGNHPAFNTKGYQTTDAIQTPGRTMREAVLIEWTDTNTSNSTFEGTARELMRLRLNTQIHPLGDLIFNPTAKPGDADWRVLYIGCGDGGSGESRNLSMRYNPQRLDTLVGKIMRIIPDLKEHTDTSKVSENGRYRVPNDNPFTGKIGARPEVWAYGLRNPHRLTWDVDPSAKNKDHLIASVIGLDTWETVVIVHKGANYGYSEREGNQRLLAPDNRLAPIPEDDRIPVRIGESPTEELVKPSYPVIEYGHTATGGDAIASGFVYRGKIAALRGKFIFGDITTGRIWWADFQEMLKVDGGDPKTMAQPHEVKILWQGEDGSQELFSSMAPIASKAYHKRGGTSDPLPGFAHIATGRTDLRFALDGEGELYLTSKSDGMIRKVVGATEQ